MNSSTKVRRGYVVSCVAAVIFVGVTMPLAAAPVQTNHFNNTSDVFYPVSSTDLINQGQPTFLNQSSTGFNVSSGSSTDNFNNGTAGASLTNADLAWDSDGAWSTTFFLDLTTSPLGYDIANIRSYAGWSTCCYGQYYNLEYSVVGDAGFIPLGTYIHDPAPTGSLHSTYIDITDTTGLLGTGVDAIRFNFFDGGTDDNAMREIDVFGVATVGPPIPEPASFMMLGLGLLGLARVRRCRREL